MCVQHTYGLGHWTTSLTFPPCDRASITVRSTMNYSRNTNARFVSVTLVLRSRATSCVKQRTDVGFRSLCAALQWVQTIGLLTIIGALTGALVFFIFLGSRQVLRYRMELIDHRTTVLLDECPYTQSVNSRVLSSVLKNCSGEGCFWYPFLTFVGFTTGLTVCSSVLVVYFLPFVASGLPELQGTVLHCGSPCHCY